MRTVAIGVFALVAAAYGQAPGSRESSARPAVVSWTGVGETGPESTTHDVFLSEDGRGLVILVPDERGAKTVTRVPLWNDVGPSAALSVRLIAPGRRLYEYTVANSSAAKDAIGTWTIIVPSTFGAEERVLSPQGGKQWGGAPATAAIARQEFLESNETGRNLRWYHHDQNSFVEPGQSVSGFGIESSLLPGFTTAWFGSGKLVEFRESWPDRIFKQLEDFDDRKWRGKATLVIGPMFSSTAPVGAVRANFVSGLKYLTETGRLDPKSAFVIEITRLLAEQDPDRLKDSVVSALPSTPLENEIGSAVEQSLGIRRQ